MKSNDSQIIDCLPIPIIVLKANAPLYTIIRINDMYEKTVNKTAEELLGHCLFEVFPDVNNNLQEILLIVEKAIKTQTSQVAPRLRYDINGQERYWSLEYVPLVKDGIVTSLIQYTQDITMLIKLGMSL